MERDKLIDRGARVLRNKFWWSESFSGQVAAAVVDAVLAALSDAPAPTVEYEQVGWRASNGSLHTSRSGTPGDEPVYRRVKREPAPQIAGEGEGLATAQPLDTKSPSPAPQAEPPAELLCAPGAPCSARCDRCCPSGYCKNCGKTMSEHGPLANCYPAPQAGYHLDSDVTAGGEDAVGSAPQAEPDRIVQGDPRRPNAEPHTVKVPAEPDRCPTCGSDDPKYVPIPPEAMGSFVIPSCRDPWHTEGADR